MSNIKKLMMTAAGGAGLNVEEVFSTYLYEGDGQNNRTITTGIDTDTEGGLVWIKNRSQSFDQELVDSERGDKQVLRTNRNGAQYNDNNSAVLTSTGFTISGGAGVNGNGDNFVSWTFRKAPKFFDVVTYTGDGTDARTVSHNLGVVPGMMIVKRTDSSGDWCVYHRSLNVNGDNAPETDFLYLNSSAAASDSNQLWDDTAPTATEFTLHGNAQVNASGGTYVAYLFAHNDGDGDFGPTGDQDIIKCGEFTTDSSGNIGEVNLGFEPQFILFKPTTGTADWWMFDTMRAMALTQASYFKPNLSNAEVTFTGSFLYATSTGFDGSGNFLGGNKHCVYIAIRRGPMAVPESATDVFAVQEGPNASNPRFTSGFPVDMGLFRRISTTNTSILSSRFTQGKFMSPSNFNSESNSSAVQFDYSEGYAESVGTSDYTAWMWGRAPSFFDVVAYDGNATQTQINHNLGVPPEMVWVKVRSGSSSFWYVWHKDLANETRVLNLNLTNAESGDTTNWGTGINPTDTTFTVGSSANVNDANSTYIAYLFASLDGVSKVGSFTSDGTDMTIDCGFSNGARFVLLKRTNTTDDWFIFRDIVAGSDKRLKLNTTAAEATGSDNIDPDSSGFIINNNILGGSGNSFIFYAIA